MNVSEALIREIVTKVLEESAGKGSKPEFEKRIDPSGIMGVKTSTVKCEPFQQDGVKLKDVVTLEEAPRMGCGIMELDHTSFEWTLTYDEYDLVLDGTLEMESTAVWCPEAPATSSISPREATFTSRPPTGPATPTLSILPTGSKGMAVSGRPSFARTSGQRREMA